MIKLLDAIETSTGLKAKPLDTDTIETCIIYRYWQTARIRYRLELRIIGFTLAEVDEIAKQVLDGINDFGDTAYVEGFASVELNGGGVLKDYATNTVQKMLYFDVVKKQEILNMAVERITLGSGKLYITEYSNSIPADADIEIDANLIGYIQGGATISYTPEFYTAEDDLGYVAKKIITDEEVVLSSGVMT